MSEKNRELTRTLLETALVGVHPRNQFRYRSFFNGEAIQAVRQMKFFGRQNILIKALAASRTTLK
jgi:hypothetical protein